MIAGSVNTRGDLLVPIRVLDANGHVHRVEAVVDTGFNGYLALPSGLIEQLGVTATELVDMGLATDLVVTVESFEGIVLWRGERRSVEILEAEGTPLIGTALLWDSLLTAEMTDNGAVAIGPLPAGVSG